MVDSGGFVDWSSFDAMENDKANESTSVASSVSSISQNSSLDGKQTRINYQSFIRRLKDPRAQGVVSFIKEFIHSFVSGENPALIEARKKNKSKESMMEDRGRSEEKGEEEMNQEENLIDLFSETSEQKLTNVDLCNMNDIDYSRLPEWADAEIVRSFILRTESFLRHHTLWSNCSEEEWTNTQEGIEKYVLTRLYKQLFRQYVQDKIEDRKLSQRIAMLSFVTFEHLDILQSSQEYSSAWKAARNELLRMNNYKSPGDKLICIVNCCKVINGLLAEASPNAGADEFLPALIYVV
eukprot:g874.t1